MYFLGLIMGYFTLVYFVDSRYWRWSPCTVMSVRKPDAQVGTVEPIYWEKHKDK
jgi:hypothetical protein